MKLTLEQLKKIDVVKYIDWLGETVMNMHYAFIEIPNKTKELEQLVLRDFFWFTCFNDERYPVSTHYKKYQELSKRKALKLEAEIGELQDRFDFAVLLSPPEQWRAVITASQEQQNTNTEQKKAKVGANDAPKQSNKEDRNSVTKIATAQKRYMKQWKYADRYKSIGYRYAEHIDFNKLLPDVHLRKTLFNNFIDWELSRFEQMKSINGNAVETVLNRAIETEYLFANDVLEARFSAEYFDDLKMVEELSKLAFYSKVANDDFRPILNENSPILWTGKVAHLGYFMGQLVDSGYIEAPKKKNGETNCNEFARQIAKVFEFDGQNVATLAKNLSCDGNNMEQKHKDQISIPHIKDLS